VELDKEQLQRQVDAVAGNTGFLVCRLRDEEFLVDLKLLVALRALGAQSVSAPADNSSFPDT
jgi:hypothetical protein